MSTTTASTHTHRTESSYHPTPSHHHGRGEKVQEKGKGGGVSLCGPCVKSFERATERADRMERERTGPKSWIERKFAVGFVIALFGWSNYTFWGVILRNTWFREEDALVGFAAGIVLTIIYAFFVLMFVLTYLKIILTPPGFAKDYVQPSEPPLAPEPDGAPLPIAYTHTAYNPATHSNLATNDIYDGNIYEDTQHPHRSRTLPPIVYPPSRKAPTSEYRHSMDGGEDGEGEGDGYDDRITHQSLSLDDHGEFQFENEHSNTRLHSGEPPQEQEPELRGVPYEKMPARPLPVHTHTHTRSRSASNTAIPPNTPLHLRSYSNSNTYPPTPTPSTPTTPASKPKPALLRKISKRGSTDGSTTTPTMPTQGNGRVEMGRPRPKKLVRAGSAGSRITTTTTTTTTTTAIPPSSTAIHGSSSSPTTPTGIKPPMSPTSRSPTTTPTAMTGMGFKYESHSYILDPPRLSSQSPTPTPTPKPKPKPTPGHGRTRSDSGIAPSPSPSSSPSPSTTRATHDLSGRTERPDGDTERPIPYLDDLPPIAPANPTSQWDRKPSEKPVLEPYYRYCSREGIVKPPRCHHCRICNTCVLGYDHHCPWVGGCVGAQNRKFFVVFLFWSTIYLLYTFALLIATIVTRANPPSSSSSSQQPVTFSTSSVDPNFIVLLVVTVLFGFFSGAMLTTHVHLLCHNASTVEWHYVQNMRERERAVVSQIVPVCECLGMGQGAPGNGGLLGRKKEGGGGGWKDEEEMGEVKQALPKGFKGRVALRKKWDSEWGRIGKEGNLWWLGSNRVNWEAVMGKNPWTWFLPVGNVAGVGVDYPRNPRFDEQGRWMKRSDWPEELR